MPESYGIDKIGIFRCSPEKPDPVFEIVNTDHKLGKEKFGDKFKDLFYLIGKQNSNFDKRDIEGTQEINRVLAAGRNIQATEARKHSPTGGLASIDSVGTYRITHIRFVGCINATEVWNKSLFADKKKFENALERR